ncbi:unnamed protein product [Prorocentrum cordatum]|uniref:Uncharacterized protein n=1 Tax=Prorocentrum cordatum TaxID=2364126 RepID=A0ABN9VEI4_9DINO|nr:unnamed protein product [Polarella glacialis]
MAAAGDAAEAALLQQAGERVRLARELAAQLQLRCGAALRGAEAAEREAAGWLRIERWLLREGEAPRRAGGAEAAAERGGLGSAGWWARVASEERRPMEGAARGPATAALLALSGEATELTDVRCEEMLAFERGRCREERARARAEERRCESLRREVSVWQRAGASEGGPQDAGQLLAQLRRLERASTEDLASLGRERCRLEEEVRLVCAEGAGLRARWARAEELSCEVLLRAGSAEAAAAAGRNEVAALGAVTTRLRSELQGTQQLPVLSEELRSEQQEICDLRRELWRHQRELEQVAAERHFHSSLETSDLRRRSDSLRAEISAITHTLQF